MVDQDVNERNCENITHRYTLTILWSHLEESHHGICLAIHRQTWTASENVKGAFAQSRWQYICVRGLYLAHLECLGL
jgi:hypothetical protein